MVTTREDLVKGIVKPKFKILCNGGFGTGKTYFAMTFPKWSYAMIEPNGILTAMSNPKLMDNMVHYEEFIPSKLEIRQCFDNLHNYITRVKKDVEAGLIETFILDNLSHLSENRWLYIDQYEPAITKKGAKDTLAQYGNLGRWLYKFILTEVIALPCHVVVNVHTMEEEEEQELANGQTKRVKTGNIITNTLGGFRKDAAGLFNANIFLETKKTGPNQYEYKARCRPGGGKEAKNNLGLPEMVDNISYKTLCDSIGLNNKKEEVK